MADAKDVCELDACVMSDPRIREKPSPRGEAATANSTWPLSVQSSSITVGSCLHMPLLAAALLLSKSSIELLWPATWSNAPSTEYDTAAVAASGGRMSERVVCAPSAAANNPTAPVPEPS